LNYQELNLKKKVLIQFITHAQTFDKS